MKLVLFMFAGRQANMEVQMPYLRRILSMYPEAELHLWDLTRDPEDQRYLNMLEGAEEGRVQVLRHLHTGHPIMCLYPNGRLRRRGSPPCTCMRHRPPYEKVYEWYAAETFDQNPSDTIYVKVDDDVLFLETDRFADLIDPVIAHPERIVSASVVNNAVCAKYQTDWAETANRFSVGDQSPRNDKRWWALHESSEFARWCHERFLDQVYGGLLTLPKREPEYVRTRPGEAVSINCIAFSHLTMRKLAAMMTDRLGDEGAVDRLLPWIALSFTAAHLSFGPQDARMEKAELDSLRNQYRQLSGGYLS